MTKQSNGFQRVDCFASLAMTVWLLLDALPLHAALTLPPELEKKIDGAIEALCHMEVRKADEYFAEAHRIAPQHPVVSFFETAELWWKGAAAFGVYEDRGSLRQAFGTKADQTIAEAEAWLAAGKNPAEAYLALGGAYGLRGRWDAVDKSWFRAYRNGKKGYLYLKKALEADPKLYDAYLGLGIYDYYTDTLSGLLRIPAFFLLRGDKAQGLKELHIAMEKGRFSRLEAALFLIGTYNDQEKDHAKALEVVLAMRRLYPDSPLFNFLEMGTRLLLGQWDETLRVAEEYYQRAVKSYKTYRPEWRGLACLFLGDAYLAKDDFVKAIEWLSIPIEQLSADRSAWITFSYLRRGQAYDLLGQREKAVQDYQTILTRTDQWGAHRRAKRCLKRPLTHDEVIQDLQS